MLQLKEIGTRTRIGTGIGAETTIGADRATCTHAGKGAGRGTGTSTGAGIGAGTSAKTQAPAKEIGTGAGTGGTYTVYMRKK